MKINMGPTDRKLRLFLVAPLAVVLAFVVGPSSVAGIVLFVVAAVMALTSLVGTCPLYLPFGVSTCRVDASAKR